MTDIKIDDTIYSYNTLTKDAKLIAGKIRSIDANIVEKTMLAQALKKARDIYKSELKLEVLGAKAAMDFEI